MFKNIRTTHAIALLVGIAAIGLLSLTILGSVSINRLRLAQDTLYLDRYFPNVQIYEVESHLLESRVAILRMMQFGYNEQDNEVVNTSLQEITEHITKYEESNMDEKEAKLLEVLKQTLIKYTSVKENMQKTLQKGDKISDIMLKEYIETLNNA